MRAYLPFVVAGLVSGSVYGLAAVGLVLTYRTTGIFNFSHGAIAAAAAYAFYDLHVLHHWAWPLAVAACVCLLAPIAGLAIERVARDLVFASVAMKVVATVGLLLALQGLLTIRYGAGTIHLPEFLPDSSFTLGGIRVGWDQVIVVAIGLVAAVLLSTLLRLTRLGISVRAVVSDPDLLDLAGTSPERTRRVAWLLGCSFAALSGILLAPTLGLDVFLLTLLVVQAFGAAAIGRFASLPSTYVGGVAVGVAAAVLSKVTASHNVLSGLPSSLPFLVLFVVLLVTPRHRLVDFGTGSGAAHVPRMVRPRKWPLMMSGLTVLLVVPHVAGPRLPVFMNALVFVIVFQSLRLLVRTSGQVSLCQAAFVAIGAAAFSHFVMGAGMPWLVALLLAAVVTVPIGAVVAVPAIRLSGSFLALATMGFGILLERLFFATSVMFGTQGQPARRPALAGLHLTRDVGFYYVLLAFVVCSTLVIVAIERSRLGRLLRGLADSPIVLTTNGADTNITLLLVFCISAFLAGVGGGLFTAMGGAASGVGFTVFQSILWLTVLAISGKGPTAPFVAAALLAVVPSYVQNPTVVALQPVAFGLVAVVVALASTGRLSSPRAAIRAATERAERARRSPVSARRVRVTRGAEGNA